MLPLRCPLTKRRSSIILDDTFPAGERGLRIQYFGMACGHHIPDVMTKPGQVSFVSLPRRV